jgi:AcrR family transcriptional regulator
MQNDPAQSPDGVTTRDRLLRASLTMFGRHDYDAVSTRQIVELADANISAISYHFGGKHELYLATAEFLAKSIRNGQRPAVDAIMARFDAGDPIACRGLLAEFVDSLARDILAGELAADGAGFIFREQLQPTAAFDILYRELIEPMHDLYARLLACALGKKPGERTVRLMTHALLGQILIFRLGQTTILRRLDITTFAPADVDRITATIVDNTLSAIDAQLAEVG